MTEAKHTPGPWIAEPRENGAVVVRGEGKRPIAEIWHNGHDPVANGALVAAAPDLLAAVQAMDRDLSRTWTSPETVQAGQGMMPERREVWRKARAALAKATLT